MIEFPSISKKDLNEASNLLEGKLGFKSKSKAIYRDFQREINEFNSKTKSMLMAHVNEIKENLIHAMDAVKTVKNPKKTLKVSRNQKEKQLIKFTSKTWRNSKKR